METNLAVWEGVSVLVFEIEEMVIDTEVMGFASPSALKEVG